MPLLLLQADIRFSNIGLEWTVFLGVRAVDCYENFQLPPIQTAEDDELGNFDWSDQVAQLQNALEEYMNLDADDMSIYGEEAEFFGDDGYSIKDPGYEGDLHTNLGSLYLAQGDMVLAASHLQQAVRKYELLGEANTHNMATAKYNLAMLYFKSSEFSKSAVFQAEAIDIFRAVGAEFSPIHVEAIEDQIQEAVLSQVKHTEGDNDEPIITDDDSNMDQSKSSDVAAKDGHATIGKDEVSGLIVDVEHFLLKNANFSLSDEL
jgi:tetratricopeptide (TPR) repeat protein